MVGACLSPRLAKEAAMVGVVFFLLWLLGYLVILSLAWLACYPEASSRVRKDVSFPGGPPRGPS